MKCEYVSIDLFIFRGRKSIPNFGFVFTKVHKKMLVLFKIILSYIFSTILFIEDL